MIYGIAETMYRDGYIEAKLFAADEEDFRKRPHYGSGLATDYSFTTYHPAESKEAAEKCLQGAKVALYSGKTIVAKFSAAGATEADYFAALEKVEEKKGVKADDVTARIVYPGPRDRR